MYQRPQTREQAEANRKNHDDEHRRISAELGEARSRVKQLEQDLAVTVRHRQMAEDDLADAQRGERLNITPEVRERAAANAQAMVGGGIGRLRRR